MSKRNLALTSWKLLNKRYAPDSYHEFIGFQVAAPLLERAFQETYGLPLKAVLSDEDKVLNSYRRAVSNQIPKATRIAWTLKKDSIQKDMPGITKRKFLFNLSRASYEKKWGKNYEQPTFGDKFLAFLYKRLGLSECYSSARPRRKRRKCLSRASIRRSIVTGLFYPTRELVTLN
jgi:hypothetical protein